MDLSQQIFVIPGQLKWKYIINNKLWKQIWAASRNIMHNRCCWFYFAGDCCILVTLHQRIAETIWILKDNYLCKVSCKDIVYINQPKRRLTLQKHSLLTGEIHGYMKMLNLSHGQSLHSVCHYNKLCAVLHLFQWHLKYLPFFRFFLCFGHINNQFN